MSSFLKANPHMLPCLTPPTPGDTAMPTPWMRTLGCRAVEGLTQGHVFIRLHRSQIPLIFPFSSSIPRSKAASLPITNTVKKEKGRETGGGGKVPPLPPAGSFLVRGKASNEGPTDAAELVVSAWEPRGAAGRTSLLPISTQVLHQSARLLPGAEARGTALLTVGGGHSSLAGPGPCTLPFCGECKAPNPLTHSHPLQSASSGQTPSPPGDTLMKMADINLFPLPTGQFIVPWGDLALGQRA